MPDEKPGRAPPDEPLLARWSRLKQEAAAAPPPPPGDAPQAEAAPVALPAVESLTPESDFSLFMQPQVQPELRQAALKKLFADPHFNVMDRLDIYIDDYTQPDPIAASIVSELVQFRNLDGLPRESTREDAPDVEASAETACATATEALPGTPGNALPEQTETASGDAGLPVLPLDTKSRSQPSIDQFVPPAAE
jgi:Protein of unknown function (DUF3306)